MLQSTAQNSKDLIKMSFLVNKKNLDTHFLIKRVYYWVFELISRHNIF